MLKPKCDQRRAQADNWHTAGRWYDRLVGDTGHDYHQALILPKTLNWMERTGPVAGLLDLGCGQGVLERSVASKFPYLGIDSAPALLRAAQRRSPKGRFRRADLTQPWTAPPPREFSHACFLLSLQNIANGQEAICNAARWLAPEGRLLIALNHPCFRVPRHSSWFFDQQQNRCDRRIDAYMSPLEIPLTIHPSQKGSNLTSNQVWCYHHPLSTYIKWLSKSGFLINALEEWVSDRVSRGTRARSENRARAEFPLFLALMATKVPLAPPLEPELA